MPNRSAARWGKGDENGRPCLGGRDGVIVAGGAFWAASPALRTNTAADASIPKNTNLRRGSAGGRCGFSGAAPIHRFFQLENLVQIPWILLSPGQSSKSASSGVSMHNLLKHLGVSDQPPSTRNQALQQKLRFTLVRVRGADEVHGDIGVYKNQT